MRGSPDGLLQVRGGVVHRLLHHVGEPVLVRVAALPGGRLLFGARAETEAVAAHGIARMRAALGVDLELAPFHARFRHDPLIGRALRANPRLRVWGRPDPFQALLWAIAEQLIEYERAVAIQRATIRRLGRQDPQSGLWDAPDAATIAGVSPALLQSLGFSGRGAGAAVRVAREITSGRLDLLDGDHEHGWRRLRAVRGIGSWTVQMLALTGQERMDQLPAGDLSYLKLVGRLTTGDPRARVEERDVERFFAPYAPWAGLAGAYALRARSRPRAALR